MPHAFIFAGPGGVGRELFAQRLAKILLCHNTSDKNAAESTIDGWSESVLDACGTCESCRLMAVDSNPDYHPIYRELHRDHPNTEVRNRKSLGLSIDVIRHFVNDQVGAKPVMGRAKVFVVRAAETMSIGAQNALLKTLEEPPATTSIILITPSANALLETTRSRCQLVTFGMLPTPYIADELQSRFAGNPNQLTADHAEWYAQRAAGSLGDAIRMHEDGLIECDERVRAILNSRSSDGITPAAKAMIQDAANLGEKFRQRDPEITDTEAQRRGLKAMLMLMSMCLREGLHKAAIDENASRRPSARAITDAIRSIATTERQIDLNASVQLCVESFLIRLRRALSA